MKKRLVGIAAALALAGLFASQAKAATVSTNPYQKAGAMQAVPSALSTITCSVVSVSTSSILNSTSTATTQVVAADSNRAGLYIINHSTNNITGPARPPEIILTPLSLLNTTSYVPALTNGVTPGSVPGVDLWPCVDNITSINQNCFYNPPEGISTQGAIYAVAESSGSSSPTGQLQVCTFDYP